MIAIGQRYLDVEGEVITVNSSWGNGEWLVMRRGVAYVYHEAEMNGRVQRGVWAPMFPTAKAATPAPSPGPGKCRHCGTENEYQDGPFTCGSCRVWGRT